MLRFASSWELPLQPRYLRRFVPKIVLGGFNCTPIDFSPPGAETGGLLTRRATYDQASRAPLCPADSGRRIRPGDASAARSGRLARDSGRQGDIPAAGSPG